MQLECLWSYFDWISRQCHPCPTFLETFMICLCVLLSFIKYTLGWLIFRNNFCFIFFFLWCDVICILTCLHFSFCIWISDEMPLNRINSQKEDHIMYNYLLDRWMCIRFYTIQFFNGIEYIRYWLMNDNRIELVFKHNTIRCDNKITDNNLPLLNRYRKKKKYQIFTQLIISSHFYLFFFLNQPTSAPLINEFPKLIKHTWCVWLWLVCLLKWKTK